MNKHILLIDDDVDELYILNEALVETRSGYECKFADNVEEGMKILRNATPDFILLDINMPRVNGLDGLSFIKKMKVLDQIPVILYSTAINEEITAKALSLGAAGCVKKTDSIKQLAVILKNLFSKSTVVPE